jgi:hypothetical protein
MAIGLLGIGSGIGFFAGPQFAGWRAESSATAWHWSGVANWQRPLIEAGIAGFVVGVVFLLVARETRRRADGAVVGSACSAGSTRPAGRRLAWRIAQLAAVLGCRDFAGLACLSLASIYLQKAHGLDAKRTGFILGAMMLISVVVSPLAVYVSAGRRRLPMLAAVLILGGLTVATVPYWPVRHVLPVLMVFMSFQLGSYALSDAAMLERVSPEVRGRVVGIFLSIAGTFSSTSPFVMGWWTDRLGTRAHEPLAYVPLFGTLGLMMVVATASTWFIARLGRPQGPPIEPLTQTTPATVEPAL